jgi:hypothetical protein
MTFTSCDHGDLCRDFHPGPSGDGVNSGSPGGPPPPLKCDAHVSRFRFISERQDFNLRHPRPKRGALTS